MMENKSGVKNIVLKHEDGTTETINRGFLASYDERAEEGIVTFQMVGMSGRDLAMIVQSVIEFGFRSGLLPEIPDIEEDDSSLGCDYCPNCGQALDWEANA